MSTVMFNESIRIDAQTVVDVEVDAGSISLSFTGGHHSSVLIFPLKGHAEEVAMALIAAVKVLGGMKESS